MNIELCAVMKKYPWRLLKYSMRFRFMKTGGTAALDSLKSVKEKK